MTGFLSFAAASFLSLVAASGMSVYVAGQVEHAWGRAGSFQVLCVLSAVAAVLLVAGFGIAAAILRRFPRPMTAAALGVGCAAAFVALVTVASALGVDPAESWLLILLLPLFGGLSQLLGARRPG